MRERDLHALEFHKVMAQAAALAASVPGRAAIEALRPSTDRAEVAARLRATAELVELRGRAGSIPMQEFADQRTLLLAAAREGAILDGASLVIARNFVLAARQLEAFLRSRVDPYPHVEALARNLVAPKELADSMLRALADDGTLLDDASPELNRLRNRLRSERAELESRLMRSLNTPGMDSFVSDYLVTVRNHRFVLPLRLNYTERLDGIVQDRSVSGETLFVEPMWAVELNNRLMMLEREAEAEERRILARLTAMVRGYGAELRMTFDAMVALDALNARASFAERLRCVEPGISDGGITLRAARHPLLVSAGRDVVPIDVSIAPDQQGIVISGPNTGGKTVALKTIGLLSMMAQAGLLIPADEGSRVMIFHRIYADIGDDQSIEASLSSFAAHIANLREMLATFDEPALVILDEPGAGTDPVEGAALAIGLMTYLGHRRCVIAVATHSAAIKLHAYSRAGYEASAVDFDPESLQPLYRLKPHTMGQSYGLAVAQRLGLPEEIIREARAAMPAGSADLERVLTLLERERAQLHVETERLRTLAREAADRDAVATANAERAAARTRADRDRFLLESREMLSATRRDAAAILDDLRAGRKSRRDIDTMLADAGATLARVAPDAAEAVNDDTPLKPGDQVEFGDIRGELVALEAGRAIVTRGGLRIEVSPERLRRSRAAAPSPAPRPQPPAITVNVAAEPGAELNLIGMRSADALRRLEEFLDQAYLTNRRDIRVVHGIGSGALRKAIHEYLTTSPYCAEFHQADPQHGGAGATIIELNL